MSQIKYTHLRSPRNMRAAAEIAHTLKRNKCMSEKEFADIYCRCTHSCLDGSFHNRSLTTRYFLYEHNIMTTQMINGLIIHVATQKCFRTKWKNLFREYQIVTNDNIDKAIGYINLNNDLVPANLEAKVVGNILKLEGPTLKVFVDNYPNFKTTQIARELPRKYQIINTLMYMERTLKLIKKV